MDQSELTYNYEVTNQLGQAITGGERGLRAVPGLLKKILKENLWQERHVRETKQTVKFKKFAEFIAALPLEGLGSDIKTLRRLCADDPEALDELEKAIQGKDGASEGNKYALKSYTAGYKEDNNITTFDNIQGSSADKPNKYDTAPTGTSEAAALRRLRKSAPKLHEKVIAGEMSANAAMVKAGFRPKTFTVPVDIEKAARVLVRNFNGDVDELIQAIQRLI
jgi:hypothetical protein